jgi:Trypsin-co-occurring domain 2
MAAREIWTWRYAMPNRESVDGLGLAEAIGSLRDDLLKARAAGASAEI